MHTYIHSHTLHTCLHTYLHTYLHTTCTYAYIYTKLKIILTQKCMHLRKAYTSLSFFMHEFKNIEKHFVHIMCMHMHTHIYAHARTHTRRHFHPQNVYLQSRKCAHPNNFILAKNIIIHRHYFRENMGLTTLVLSLMLSLFVDVSLPRPSSLHHPTSIQS